MREDFVGIPFHKHQMLFVYLLLLLMVGMGFFSPLLSGNWLGILVKLIIFIAVIVISYPVFFS